VTSVESSVRSALLSAPEVSRLSELRRSTSLCSQGGAADSLYFVETGLVKLTRTNEVGNQIILCIRGAGDLIGEEALSENKTYYANAEVLTPSSAYRMPAEFVRGAFASNPELATSFINYLLSRQDALAEKVELLCLHDVEHRVLHYLAELSSLVGIAPDGQGFQIPITQLELADLIGATRETTSTTLNQLERRGLIKLSRRMLTVPSPERLIAAASERTRLPPPPSGIANSASSAVLTD
jgi:CRP/FNR family transcriptional regulator, cyclic AMP receptor protein